MSTHSRFRLRRSAKTSRRRQVIVLAFSNLGEEEESTVNNCFIVHNVTCYEGTPNVKLTRNNCLTVHNVTSHEVTGTVKLTRNVKLTLSVKLTRNVKLPGYNVKLARNVTLTRTVKLTCYNVQLARNVRLLTYTHINTEHVIQPQ